MKNELIFEEAGVFLGKHKYSMNIKTESQGGRLLLRILLFLLMVGVMIGSVCHAVPVRAEVTGEEAFEDMDWEVVYREDVVKDTGVVQSICATDQYIVIIENTADNSEVNDTVSAYYRYDHDADGNPVEQYSLAKRVQDSEWEHGNGMTYNPKTNEIYVALYTSLVEGNEGSLYVMDPETLEYKRTIHVEDGYNILGIDYVEDKDQYVIQTNASAEYSMKILNADFEVEEDLGPVDTTPGINYQDLCVCEDYVLLSPLSNTSAGDNTDYINIYSLSQKKVIMTEILEPDVPVGSGTELESICNLGNGEFLIIENVRESSGYRYFQFYETKVPYYFTITTEGRHGTVTDSSEKVLRGEDFTVDFSAEEGYETGTLTIDGEDVNSAKYPDGYTFEDVQEDHEFILRCTPVLVAEADVNEATGTEVNLVGVLLVLILLPLLGVTFATYLLLMRKKRQARRGRSRGYRKAVARKLAMDYPELGYGKEKQTGEAKSGEAASVIAANAVKNDEAAKLLPQAENAAAASEAKAERTSMEESAEAVKAKKAEKTADKVSAEKVKAEKAEKFVEMTTAEKAEEFAETARSVHAEKDEEKAGGEKKPSVFGKIFAAILEALATGLGMAGAGIVRLVKAFGGFLKGKLDAKRAEREKKKARKLAHEQHRARLQEARRKRLAEEAAQAEREREKAREEWEKDEALRKEQEMQEAEAMREEAAQVSEPKAVRKSRKHVSENAAGRRKAGSNAEAKEGRSVRHGTEAEATERRGARRGTEAATAERRSSRRGTEAELTERRSSRRASEAELTERRAARRASEAELTERRSSRRASEAEMTERRAVRRASEAEMTERRSAGRGSEASTRERRSSRRTSSEYAETARSRKTVDYNAGWPELKSDSRNRKNRR